ncbi:unnamed protein product [Linum trigynum]|uniref:Uncharacterized protein n=1 Tax=Linum trigynum TaxID=586398 RepID=A0AAV2FAG0_9ROSI
MERLAWGSEGASSGVEQPCYTTQEPKSQLELMMEWFTESRSDVESSTTTPIDSSLLRTSEEILRKMERLGEIVEQACARLAHNHILSLEKHIFEEGRQVEDEFESANGVQDEDDAKVDETSTSYKYYEVFPPDLDVVLEKDPFVTLCQAKAKPSVIPLGGCNGSQSLLHYMVWGKERRMKERRRGLVGGASRPLKLTSPQTWTRSKLVT